nr:hypothetical protein [Tanacetum cinerariifolium]
MHKSHSWEARKCSCPKKVPVAPRVAFTFLDVLDAFDFGTSLSIDASFSSMPDRLTKPFCLKSPPMRNNNHHNLSASANHHLGTPPSVLTKDQRDGVFDASIKLVDIQSKEANAADNLLFIILLSGDGDFVKAIQSLKDLGANWYEKYSRVTHVLEIMAYRMIVWFSRRMGRLELASTAATICDWNNPSERFSTPIKSQRIDGKSPSKKRQLQ